MALGWLYTWWIVESGWQRCHLDEVVHVDLAGDAAQAVAQVEAERESVHAVVVRLASRPPVLHKQLSLRSYSVRSRFGGTNSGIGHLAGLWQSARPQAHRPRFVQYAVSTAWPRRACASAPLVAVDW
jgi:hypothetical protein